jgi:hypothetical protein
MWLYVAEAKRRCMVLSLMAAVHQRRDTQILNDYN